MTLVKYWVCSLDLHDEGNELDHTSVYLASDVDQVVEELRERIKVLEKRIASQRSSIAGKEELHKETKDKLQADLARVTAELKEAKATIQRLYDSEEWP